MYREQLLVVEIIMSSCEPDSVVVRCDPAVVRTWRAISNTTVMLHRMMSAEETTNTKRTIQLLQTSPTRFQVQNWDLQKFSATKVEAQEAAKNFQQCVEELAGRNFAQNVEAAALAVMTRVLVRGLNARNGQTSRCCCVTVGNMCKLMTIRKNLVDDRGASFDLQG